MWHPTENILNTSTIDTHWEINARQKTKQSNDNNTHVAHEWQWQILMQVSMTHN